MPERSGGSSGTADFEHSTGVCVRGEARAAAAAFRVDPGTGGANLQSARFRAVGISGAVSGRRRGRRIRERSDRGRSGARRRARAPRRASPRGWGQARNPPTAGRVRPLTNPVERRAEVAREGVRDWATWGDAPVRRRLAGDLLLQLLHLARRLRRAPGSRVSQYGSVSW